MCSVRQFCKLQVKNCVMSNDIQFRPRTHSESLEFLEKKLQLLELLCQKFDDGECLMIEPISGVLRNILHQSGTSYAVLKQAGKWSTKFFDSFLYPQNKNLLIYNGITRIYINPSDKGVPFAPLDEWPPFGLTNRRSCWEKKILWSPFGKFSREELALFMANQEALHMEKRGIDIVYENLRNLFLQMPNFQINGSNVRIDDIVGLAIRQVAHELLKTLRYNYSKKPFIEAKMFIGPIEMSNSILEINNG